MEERHKTVDRQITTLLGSRSEYNTVDLQWLEHWWLVYHGYFELVFEFLGKYPIAADSG